MARQHLIANNAGHSNRLSRPSDQKAILALDDPRVRAARRHDHALFKIERATRMQNGTLLLPIAR
jgi:hypothetical protein